VTKPIQGAQRGGLDGFVKGIAAGAVGLIVKPVVGVADGIRAATEGIKNTTNVRESSAVRQRPPRTFGLRGELRAFRGPDAEVQRTLEASIYAGGGRCRPLADGRFCSQVPTVSPTGTMTSFVVTSSHVLLLSILAPPPSSAARSSSLSERSDRSSSLAERSGSLGEVGAASDSQRYTLGTIIWTEALANIGAWECVDQSAAELALHLRNGGVRLVRFASLEARRAAVGDVKQAVEAHSGFR